MTPILSQGVQSGHTGVARPRTGPELSDIALFVLAGVGLWFVRRALRARFRKGPPNGKD